MCAFLHSRGTYRYINTNLESQQSIIFFWHFGYIILKKLMPKAVRFVSVIAEFYTVESQHQILNGICTFVILEQN